MLGGTGVRQRGGLPSYGGADGQFGYGPYSSSRSSKRSSGSVVGWAVGVLLLIVCSGLGYTLIAARTQLTELTEHVGMMEQHLVTERVSTQSGVSQRSPAVAQQCGRLGCNAAGRALRLGHLSPACHEGLPAPIPRRTAERAPLCRVEPGAGAPWDQHPAGATAPGPAAAAGRGGQGLRRAACLKPCMCAHNCASVRSHARSHVSWVRACMGPWSASMPQSLLAPRLEPAGTSAGVHTVSVLPSSLAAGLLPCRSRS